MRTAFAVAVIALLATPAAVAGEGDPHRDRKHDNKGRGKRIETSVSDFATSDTEGRGIQIERSVPEPATVLLLGAAGGVCLRCSEIQVEAAITIRPWADCERHAQH